VKTIITIPVNALMRKIFIPVVNVSFSWGFFSSKSGCYCNYWIVLQVVVNSYYRALPLVVVLGYLRALTLVVISEYLSLAFSINSMITSLIQLVIWDLLY
jgi:hypothetical protein